MLLFCSGCDVCRCKSPEVGVAGSPDAQACGVLNCMLECPVVGRKTDGDGCEKCECNDEPPSCPGKGKKRTSSTKH